MRVLVGLSGGVDSSVALCLLQKQGNEVIGATMSIWDKEKYHLKESFNLKDACFSPHEEKDIEAAQTLCKRFNVPYYVVDCSKEYQKFVLENFKQEYLAGRTPNPCVMCNHTVKFEALPEGARAMGIEFEKFATGHYARVSYNKTLQRYQLRRAVDEAKDQSYFLYRLSQDQLSKMILPLGDYTKQQVRKTARELGLTVSDKKDSQDFYSGDVNDILEEPAKEGYFVDKSGKILGKHQGIWHFTIGQRRGLGVSADRPLYVIGLNKDRNEVVLGYEEDGYKSSMIVRDLVWVSVAQIKEKTTLAVKIRSSQKPFSAAFEPLEGNMARLSFFEKQKAVALGQSAVFYDEDGFVLGGGFIAQADV
ncbi:MAG: tRNA 2-thiouridine(34) synthase MnmA [Alphaproteobacteria bacterium]|nr:tRNA 2-thiouridine(34) synthase MnmA [Alphaproteobacteria bacterium]